MKPPIIMMGTILWVVGISSLPACAQTTLIGRMDRLRRVVVGVTAENRGMWPRGRRAALDASGRPVPVRRAALGRYRRNGAGVVIHPSGIIVTNAHTVGHAEKVTVLLPDGTRHPGRVVRFVPDLDCALIRVLLPEGTVLPYAGLADSDALDLGDEVYNLGRSPWLDRTISSGRIIGLGRNRTPDPDDTVLNDLLQTSIELYHGDSGGPLFNAEGGLVGLITAEEESRHSTFAIPSNRIRPILTRYLAEGGRP